MEAAGVHRGLGGLQCPELQGLLGKTWTGVANSVIEPQMGTDQMSAQLPRYTELPIRQNAPPKSAWGVFGDTDQIGTLNLLEPALVARAARLVQKGLVFSLNWSVEKPDPDLWGREP